MPIFVALMRGINVGKAKRIPMAELRALLEELGYTNVATLLNSGNAVFRSAKGTPASHAKQIAAAIASRMGFDVPVVVKSAKELAAIVAENPLAKAAANHSQLLTVFAQDHKTLTGLSTIATLIQPPEQFVVGDNAAYLHCAAGILESKAGEALLGKAGKSVTTRNWATVLKLQALVDESKT
ncbi:DUF1697 domain-containing protein [Rhodoferax saidenbachensis]|uniref:DUF1697 domain-containing protein n=1 Tax=Rhodoferax saidenbachensis TaxID=1484693 RepID=A0A1P8KB62_9BURK|nr:DUF1697 domain-containing protein [Rhodoferax saidenbachensis]APW43243.1 hypothetical protein RS694_12380 [Rhodoferax saidenbachensis]